MNTRRLIGCGLALAAVGLMALSAYTFAQGIKEFTAAVWLAVAGAVMIGMGLLITRRTRHAVPLQANEGGNGKGMIHHAPTQRRGEQATGIRWGWLMAGIVALALLATINGLPQEDNNLPLIGWLWYVPSQLQFVLLWGGLAMLVWAFRPHPPTPSSYTERGRSTLERAGAVGAFHETPLPKHESRLSSFLTWENGLLLAIILLALVLRLWNLEGAIHRYIDEIHFANAVVRLSDEANTKILMPFGDVTAFTWVFPHFEWLSVRLFGPSLASLRLPSALMGALNVWALYWLAKLLFDRKTALLAALFLATFPPHIHFSRLALNNIADPLFGTLALALMARAMTSPPGPLSMFGEGAKGMNHHAPTNGERIWYWALAGVCLGLTQFFYEGGKLLFPPLVVAWVAWMMIIRALTPRLPLPHGEGERSSRQGQLNAPSIVNVLILVGVALVVVAPLYYALTTSYSMFSPRLFFTGWLSNPQNADLATTDNFARHVAGSIPYAFAALVQLKDGSWFYGGQTALILPLVVPLFLLGVAQAVWRVLSPGGSLLLLWVAGTILGNSVLTDATHFPRFVVVFPALALLMAVGVRYTWGMIFEGSSRQSDRSFTQHSALSTQHFQKSMVVLIVIGLAVASVQTSYYFGTHMGQFFLQNRLAKDTDDALFRALDLPTGTDVFIVGRQILWSYNVDTVLRFYGRDDLYVLSYAPADFALVLEALPLNRDYAFFVEPEDLETARVLRERFGDIGAAQVSPYEVPMDKHYVMYRVRGLRTEGSGMSNEG